MTKKRLGNLDLLKFIAACCIALHHFQQSFEIHFEKYLNFYDGKFYFGYLVELFFIISGFLTAKSSNSKENDGFYNNVKKHWIRLFPYAFIATTFACIVVFVYKIKMHDPMPGVNYSVFNVVTSLLMVHEGWFFQYNIGINNPTWYIGVLMWIYIVYYAIDSSIRKMKKNNELRLIIYNGIILLGIYISYVKYFGFVGLPFLYKSDARGYMSFFLGVIIYYIYENVELKIQLVVGGFLFISGIVTLLRVVAPTEFVSTFLLYPGLLLIIVNIKQIENGFIHTLGQVSFEMYIWHSPIYFLMYLLFNNTGFDFLHNYGIMFVCLLAVIVVAFIVYYSIEVPLSRKLNKLSDSVSQRRKLNKRTN